MKKVLKWLNANKMTVSGLIALLIFFIDELFQCIGLEKLPDGLHYVIITALYLLVGYSIKGRGLETIERYEEVIKNKAQLSSKKKNLKDFLLYLFIILFKKETKTDEIVDESTENKEDK